MGMKLGNAEINAVSVIEPYDDSHLGDIYANSSLEPEWVRPSEWLDLPVINSGESKIAMLMLVESGAVNKNIGMQLRNYAPNYLHTTIDWGDGSSSLAYSQTSNAEVYHHDYNYSDLPESSEIDLYGTTFRQTLIQMDAASGLEYFNISQMNGSANPNRDSFNSNAQSNLILDVHISLSSLGTFVNGGSSSRDLERVRVDCGNITTASVFSYLPSLRVAHISSGAFSGNTNLSNIFVNCPKLQSAPILETSSATNMQGIFGYCYSLKSIPTYDTSNVTNFYTAFYQCKSLKEFPAWDFSKANNLSHAFNSLEALKSIPHGISWPTGLYNSTNLFSSCSELVYAAQDINLSGASTLSSMFSNCKNLKKVPKIFAPNATHMRNCFNVTSLEKVHVEDISSVTDMHYAFAQNPDLKEVICENIPTGVTSFFACFHQDYKLKKAPNFDTSNATDIRHMFDGADIRHAVTIDMSNATNLLHIFNSNKQIKDVKFLNIDNKITDASTAFANCYSLTSIPSGLFQDYNSSPSKVNGIFSNCNIREAKDVDLSGCTNTSNHSPFYNNVGFRTFENIKFGPEIYLYGFMYGNKYISRIPDWDVSGVKNLDHAFRHCHSLEWSDLKNTECSISYYDCLLGSGALENIFINLASGVTAKTLDITQNYGTSQLHPDTIAIATNKGWVVTT